MIADAISVGDTTIDRVMLGDVEVWSAAPVVPDLPVVTITGTSGNVSRDQFRAACIAYGTTYNTVTELPFRLDTSNATDMPSMFYGCSALTSVPDMDTSNANRMSSMFYGCSALTSVPDMDTSNVEHMSSMFRDCYALTSVPPLDTSNATDMSSMFYGCSALAYVSDMDTSNVAVMSYMFYGCSALTDGNVRLIGKHPTVNTTGMILNSGLTRAPFYDQAGNPI